MVVLGVVMICGGVGRAVWCDVVDSSLPSRVDEALTANEWCDNSTVVWMLLLN